MRWKYWPQVLPQTVPRRPRVLDGSFLIECGMDGSGGGSETSWVGGMGSGDFDLDVLGVGM